MTHVRQLNMFRKLAAIGLISILIFSGCLGLPSPEGPPPQSPAPAPEPAITYTCEDVVLAATSGKPTNRVGLFAVPTQFDDLVAFRVTDVAGAASVVIPIERQPDGSGTFVVPLHPNGNQSGGPARLQMIDGSGQDCDQLEFAIAPLPDSPGAFASFVELIEQIYLQTGRVFGHTSAADGLPGAEPSLLALPLELAGDWIDGPENPNSLVKIAGGEAVATAGVGPGDWAVLDSIIAESGILPELQARLRELESSEAFPGVEHFDADATGASVDAPALGQPRLLGLATGSGPAQPVALTAAGSWLDITLFCNGPWYRPDAEALSFMMYQQDRLEHFQKKSEPYTTAASTLATVVGILSLVPTAGVPNPYTVAAGGVALGLSSIDMMMETGKNLLPSEMTALTFHHENEVYMEDAPDLTGHWEWARLTTMSRGMSLDATILNQLLKVASGGLSKTFLGEHYSAKIVKGTADFLTGAFSQGSSQRLAQRWGDPNTGQGLVNLPACKFGPTDISEEPFSKANFFPADSPVFSLRHGTFEVVDVGVSDLIVRPNKDRFAGKEFTAGRRIEIKPIEVIMSPDMHFVAPGDVVVFHVEVENAHDASLRFNLDGDGHEYEVRRQGCCEYIVTVSTSPHERDFPATLRATSTSRTGLRGFTDSRGFPTAPERYDLGLIRTDPELNVIPHVACVEPGKTEQFSVDSDGPVRWTATAGTISATGLFTAPDQEGPVTVRATSISDSSVWGEATVTVGDCVCWSVVSYGDTQLSADHGTLVFTDGSSGPRLAGLSFYHDLRTGHRWYIAGMGSARYSAEILSLANTTDYRAFHNIRIPASGGYGYPYPWGSPASGKYYTPSDFPKECYENIPDSWSACYNSYVERTPLDVQVTITQFDLSKDQTKAYVKGSLTGRVNAQLIRPQEPHEVNALDNPWQEVPITAYFQGYYDTEAFPNPTEATNEQGMNYAFDHTRLYCQVEPRN